MTTLPRRWRVYHGRDPEVERRRLKRRFRTISRRYHRAQRLRRLYRRARLKALVLIGAIGLYFALTIWSPWPPMLTLRHLASFPNCDAVQAVGLAPAMRGKPGYWQSNDGDGDGQACEAWPRR